VLRKTILSAVFAWGLLSFGFSAAGQTLYRIEKEPRPRSAEQSQRTDLGLAHVTLVSGFRTGAEEDFDLHAFAWRDGYSTIDGQPTYGVQVALHRKPEAFRHIPDITDAKANRNVEWRIPVIAVTYHIYPDYANPYKDKPLAILSGKQAEEGFRATVGSLPARRFAVRAEVEHRGVQRGESYSFNRSYVFRPPTVAVMDGRHEPYDLYHWLW
jgi:hypothetical protein